MPWRPSPPLRHFWQPYTAVPLDRQTAFLSSTRSASQDYDSLRAHYRAYAACYKQRGGGWEGQRTYGLNQPDVKLGGVEEVHTDGATLGLKKQLQLPCNSLDTELLGLLQQLRHK